MSSRNQRNRKFLALTLLSAALLTTTFANAESGPRNTVPRAHGANQIVKRSFDGLQASREEAAACQKVRIAHYGHPAKGIDRVERIDVQCGKMRLSAQ